MTSASAAAESAPRVVVTGAGCVSPLGLDLEATWASAIEGRGGIRPITRFDCSEYPVTFAGELPGDVPGSLPLGDLPAKEVRRLDLGVLFAVVATGEALARAGLELGGCDLDRAGVAIGSGISGLGTLLENHKLLLERGPRRISPFTIPMSIANMPAGYVSIHHGLRGPNLCHVSACASAAHAIGEAVHVIRRGDADLMVAGGTEAPITDIGVAGFAAMRALSTRNDEPGRASRPFDVDRDGFVMGEGAGVLILESEAHARARGAAIWAEVAGYGASADASHIAAPAEDGQGIVRCMRAAIESAGLRPDQVDHVNAHATSTPAGDRIEAAALREVFGDHVEGLPVSATKSLTGHLLGAAGALESILSIQALRTGLLAPTINLDRVDPDCVLDHVVGKARPVPVTSVLSNSFGFGGTNAALLFRSVDA